MHLHRFFRAIGKAAAPVASIPSRMGKAKRGEGGGNTTAPAAAAVTAALVLLLALCGCSRPPPEERLRSTLAQMQKALESREPARFMEHVAEDFVGNAGLDRDALQQMVRAQVLLNRDIGLTLGPVEVEMGEGLATASFPALVAGGSGRLLPERGGAWQVTTGWRDEDGHWRLQYARWQRH